MVRHRRFGPGSHTDSGKNRGIKDLFWTIFGGRTGVGYTPRILDTRCFAGPSAAQHLISAVTQRLTGPFWPFGTISGCCCSVSAAQNAVKTPQRARKCRAIGAGVADNAPGPGRGRGNAPRAENRPENVIFRAGVFVF